MRTLARYRLTSIPLVLAGAIIINFLLYHLSPGDPSNQYFGPEYDQENKQVLQQKMGLDKPLHIQFVDWFSHFIRGDFGYSWVKHRPVNDILKEAVPATLELTVISLIINFILGTGLGVISGMLAQKWIGKTLNYANLLFYSIPSFWLAIFLIYIFSIRLEWLPASGQSSLVLDTLSAFGTFSDRVRHLIMPATVLGLSGGAATFRVVQANTTRILNEQFITSARARGLSPCTVLYKHALKNILLPVITMFGLYFPFLLGGALIVEVIFAWPGMGRIAFEAVTAKDFPVIMAVNYMAAVMVIFGNFTADLLCSKSDPRI